MSNCYKSRRKEHLIDTAHYLLKQTCCNKISCTDLVKDLQTLQFKCNDMFSEENIGEIDAKGNIQGTLCDELKDKKIDIAEFSKQFIGGRKKMKRKTKKRKTKKSRKNIKKSRKYRRSKK